MHQQINEITIKLFRYFNVHFRDVERKIAEQDKHIEGLYRLVDPYIKQLDNKSLDGSVDEVRLRRLEQKVTSLARQARNRTMPR